MASKLQAAGYVGVLAGALGIAFLAGYTPFASRINNIAYDSSSRDDAYRRPPESVVIAIDEATLQARGGTRNYRGILSEALDQLAAAEPAAVAIDMILADDVDPGADARLEAAMRATPHLILQSGLTTQGIWEDPAARFRPLAGALGHAHFEVERNDGVSRNIALALVAGGQPRQALALEAYRVAHNEQIVQTPVDIEVGSLRIPVRREEDPGADPNQLEELVTELYRMPIRYRQPGEIPRINVLQIAQNHDAIRGKTAFIGVTALSAANDRLVNPSGVNVAGVEVHAHAYETLARGEFLTRAPESMALAICTMLAAFMGIVFWYLSGWRAYLLAAAAIGVAFWLPSFFYGRDVIFPAFGPIAVAWISGVGAASYQHFVVRRQLRRAESEKSRYQQAIHWAAHEMRTPLTAIQGSSELMTRYNLPDAKRTQLSEMINSESKRLARIIQTFLDVERLAEGQVELKREPFAAAGLVETCLARVGPLAESKRIEIALETPVHGTLLGDRELMEFALYNLLTNAVKYSPAGTRVRVRSALRGAELRLAVEDEGMGMDDKELKSIFQKFYRTKRAEASGEAGTGIGLSIVQQIVSGHGGRIDVISAPGKGSCFTMILAAQSATTHAQASHR